MAEKVRLKWAKYNPHPQRKNVEDCVKRAICAATGDDYLKVQRDLNRIKREIFGDEYREHTYWERPIGDRYAEEKGWTYVHIADSDTLYNSCVGTTVRDFIEVGQLHGTYMFRCKKRGERSSHKCTVKHGVLYDTWDSRDTRISDVWVVEGEFEVKKGK